MASDVRDLIDLARQSGDPNALALLADSAHASVRWAVAKNPATPPETLVQLTTDPWPSVQLMALTAARYMGILMDTGRERIGSTTTNLERGESLPLVRDGEAYPSSVTAGETPSADHIPTPQEKEIKSDLDAESWWSGDDDLGFDDQEHFDYEYGYADSADGEDSFLVGGPLGFQENTDVTYNPDDAEVPSPTLDVYTALAVAAGTGYARTVNLDELIASARNRETPANLLDALARGSDWYITALVARNPGVNAETLRLIERKKSAYLNAQIAENPAIPADTAKRLARRVKEHATLLGLAENCNTPFEVLYAFAEGRVGRFLDVADTARDVLGESWKTDDSKLEGWG